MSILKKIADAFKPLVLTDPTFGILRFQKVGFWEGKLQFKPLSTEIEVLVDGDQTGPTEEQQSWFKQIESRYTDFLPQIVDAAMPSVHEWKGNLTKENMMKELKLETISVNRCEPEKHEWCITFYSQSLEHWVSLSFTDWTGIQTTIDG